jgi:hypothetical protein
VTDTDDPDRVAIRAAAKRLLDGTPLRSSGALTIVGLAAEAGVKRWLLTHKHRDLAEQFQARAKAVGGDPPQIAELKDQIRQLTNDNTRLRKENAEQHELTQFYANVINELAAALDCTDGGTGDTLLAEVRPIMTAPGRRLSAHQTADDHA